MHRLLIVVALAGGVIALSSVARAQEVPAPPQNVEFDGTTLTWTDLSDNETGFRVVAEIRFAEGHQILLTYDVAADVTSFELPANATDLRCPGGYVGYTLIAFNDGGESLPSAQLGLACPPVDFQGGPEDLPDAGSGPNATSHLPLSSIVLAGVALLLAGLALRQRTA